MPLQNQQKKQNKFPTVMGVCSAQPSQQSLSTYFMPDTPPSQRKGDERGDVLTWASKGGFIRQKRALRAWQQGVPWSHILGPSKFTV